MSEVKAVDTVAPAFYKVEETNFTLLPLNDAGASAVRLLKDLRKHGNRTEEELAKDPDAALDAVESLAQLVRSLLPRSQRRLWDDLDPSINEIQEAFSVWSKSQGSEEPGK